MNRGGKRKGAGRKPKGEKAGVSHAARPVLSGREPVLITFKLRRRLANLRGRRSIRRMLEALWRAKERFGTRIIHYSVQSDHIHLIIEAESTKALSRAMQGLAVRIARTLNRVLGRKGTVLKDRYHHRVLTSPRQVRNALAYVLCNARKHGCAPSDPRWLDPYSSARAFDGWKGVDACPGVIPVVAPKVWLLTKGWRRGGLLDPAHVPSRAPS